MKIKQITTFKSKTIGSIDVNGKTRFKKVQFEAVAELDEKEAELELQDRACHKKLSNYVEDCLNDEAKK